VTGPTGSGKTVTLYSALNYLNTSDKNLSTVEDPVEIQLPGINQVNIQPKINLDFAAVLKTLLRQDPDILMVGEIRDKETADITIQAAATGHLVLSTLHTNSAIETINRFKSMKISLHTFVNTLTLIISQRLIRVLCEHCKHPEPIPKNNMGLNPEYHNQLIFRAGGCVNCLNGYKGRKGIYELFPMTEEMATLILNGANKQILLNEALLAGYTSLQTAAINNILNGTTSLAEIQRVLQ
jgi:type IV pilus assembly protein PilB